MNDLARRPPGHELTSEVLAEAEYAVEVHVHHFAPVLFGKIEKGGAADDAGIVHENIGPAERAQGFRHHRPGGGGRADVQHEREAPATERRDGAGGFAGIGAGHQDDVGAGFRQSDGQSGAEPARSAGDNRHFCIEPETIENRGHGDNQRRSAMAT